MQASVARSVLYAKGFRCEAISFSLIAQLTLMGMARQRLAVLNIISSPIKIATGD